MDDVTNLFLVLFGVVSAWLGWRALQRAQASLAWPRVWGEIVSSTEHVTYNGEYESRYAVITYDYTVAGATYQGRRVFFGDAIGLLWDEPRQQRLDSYQAGWAVEVAYDPAAPQEAVLEPGVHWATYLAVLGPAVVAVYGLFRLVGVV